MKSLLKLAVIAAALTVTGCDGHVSKPQHVPVPGKGYWKTDGDITYDEDSLADPTKNFTEYYFAGGKRCMTVFGSGGKWMILGGYGQTQFNSASEAEKTVVDACDQR